MHIALGKRVRQKLIALGALAGCIAVCGVASPAMATNENYECTSCNFVNGKDNWVKNNFAINHSGGGACTKLWELFGGSYFERAGSNCVSGGNTAHQCELSEALGHGEVKAFESNGLLKGRQDNFAGCE